MWYNGSAMKKLSVVLLCLFLCSAASNAEFRVASVCHAPGTSAAPFAPAPVLEKAPFSADSELLEIDFININIGDAVFISCGGETMLVDGGTQSKAEVLKAFFKERGVTGLTYYFNSHSHDDHIMASTALVEAGFPAKEYLGKYAPDSRVPSVKKLQDALKEKEIPYRRLRSLDSITLGGARLVFLQNERPQAGHGVNARSMMIYIIFKANTLLLTADVTGYSLAQVMEDYPEFMKADIIKAPHHGIDRLRPEFIDFVAPELFIITGPDEQGTRLTDQLRKLNMPRYYTAMGTVHLTSDGTSWYVRQLN